MTRARYDAIGFGYSTTRREDPHLRRRIHAALGEARTLVNVGAGTGSYEPVDRWVLAIEPSDVMAAQRPADHVPALRGTAGTLPLRDAAVDAAMAILSMHHWDDERERGVRELRRVATGPVVIVTIDPDVSSRMWLPRHYLPELVELDRRIFPSPATVAQWLGDDVTVEVIPTPSDTPDWTLASFWAHPERVFDPAARAATSGFARMPDDVVARAVAAVGRDLASGTWDAHHGHLRTMGEYDAGMRLIISPPQDPVAAADN